MQLDPKLIFVYNADSGLFNLLADAAHRVVRPSTYPCKLCAVTYTFTGMRSEWRDFIQLLGFPVEFLHRDELAEIYGIVDVPLPAVFVNGEDRTRLWISAADINGCRSLEDLKLLVSERIQAITRGARGRRLRSQQADDGIDAIGQQEHAHDKANQSNRA